jgi:transposase IS116/IS110/IS902 family protein
MAFDSPPDPPRRSLKPARLGGASLTKSPDARWIHLSPHQGSCEFTSAEALASSRTEVQMTLLVRLLISAAALFVAARVVPGIARHLASWAALCPGHHESGGKHKSGKTRKGNRWLRTALIEAAAGASRAKHSALKARFRRVLRHRGPKKAVMAVAHALLRMVYHVLAEGTVYREAGADYYDRHHRQRVTRRALQALERRATA